MITALHIEDHTRTGLAAVLSLFSHNRIRVEHMYCDAASLKSITYEHHRGKVSWAAIDRFVKAQRNHLLCDGTLELPRELGYKRFVSHELMKRMCENAALYLLDALGDSDVRVTLIDDTGDHVELCRYLIDYTNYVQVVTQTPDVYIEEADRLLTEKGAALRISRNDDSIRYADIIIAPQRLSRDIVSAENAVILSAQKPEVRQNAPVIYEYFFDLPEKYREIKPDYLDDMYFASAMYMLAKAYEMGSYTFKRCFDGRIIHTRMSLLEQLKLRRRSLT